MRRLSRSVADLKQHYDVVVVGSGYGGGIAASRLARCGKSVCLLERGKEIPIGDYPTRLLEAQREFQVTAGSEHAGSRTGLYDLRLHKDIAVMQGCGLGGTSLINANVSLPADPRVFQDPCWPNEIIGDPALTEGFARAHRMLRPKPYPDKAPLPKYRAVQAAAKAIGATAEHPPINVTFEEETNPAGVVQPACNFCGDCVSGCNVGAKNTTLVTYLPDAVNHGAEIYTEAKVSHVAKERGKWRVYFEMSGHEREKFGAPEQSIACDIVVLAGGTLGSTEILLRSREAGLAVSDKLGERFTGNGDVLAFAYNNESVINGIGFGHPARATPGPVGPCISGLIDLRGSAVLEDGYVIEEGTMPAGIASILPGLLADGAPKFGEPPHRTPSQLAEATARELKSRLLGAYQGAVNHTQTFLVMSHDDGRGVMRLKDGRFDIDWPGLASQPIFKTVGDKLQAVSAATGGTYIQNPLQQTLIQQRMISVHPLGGCIMAADRRAGVVNHMCQVFDGGSATNAEAVHEGLYVCDGAVIPRSLGVNPLLTISAIAERAMIYLARDRGWGFDDKPKAGVAKMFAGVPLPRAEKAAGVEFTERMAGFISRTELADYKAAEAAGKKSGDTFSFTLTVRADNVDAFVADPEHTAPMFGSAICPALSPEPLDVSNAVFNLMRVDTGRVDTRRFDYRMSLVAKDGAEYHFEGFKIVHDDHQMDLWPDTSTLYIDITKGRDGRQGPVAKGILHIDPKDFAVQLQTLKGLHGRGLADRTSAIAKFGMLFAGTLFDTFGGVLTPTQRFEAAHVRSRRELRVGHPEMHTCMTEDGKRLRLTRFRGGDKGPVIFTHGLGVSSLIFSIDTIDTNMLEYLYASGYDCWLLDFRASIDLPYCEEQFTADDVATKDYPAAVGKVREVTGRESVQMIVHCFGATTFIMAMLAGLQGVRSAVVSQIATDVLVPWFPQRLLAYLRLPSLMKASGIRLVDARAVKTAGLNERLIDALIRVFLPFRRDNRTANATSNRITALYGQLYQLDQLNDATAKIGLPLMFGRANIKAFEQLALIARKKRIVDARGRDVYLPHMQRLAIPMLIIHGQENRCFKLQSTRRTLARLQAANPGTPYERHEIPGHGHIDCIFGKNATTAVYPLVVAHLDKSADAQLPVPGAVAAPVPATATTLTEDV